ncbi:hypothetical protein GGX14DRAFT_399667 [Mycena pura]|uniref:Uncharacterized protein n=1 Tax=Mycena pura TaxID=153505 RepID=A0AAD6Y6M7_9AGAR|nr:hypothetical protein GGX14DRAFT_399667 [Mycena pura]
MCRASRHAHLWSMHGRLYTAVVNFRKATSRCAVAKFPCVWQQGQVNGLSVIGLIFADAPPLRVDHDPGEANAAIRVRIRADAPPSILRPRVKTNSRWAGQSEGSQDHSAHRTHLHSQDALPKTKTFNLRPKTISQDQRPSPKTKDAQDKLAVLLILGPCPDNPTYTPTTQTALAPYLKLCDTITFCTPINFSWRRPSARRKVTAAFGSDILGRRLTECQSQKVAMPTTNDVNEGFQEEAVLAAQFTDDEEETG